MLLFVLINARITDTNPFDNTLISRSIGWSISVNDLLDIRFTWKSELRLSLWWGHMQVQFLLFTVVSCRRWVVLGTLYFMTIVWPSVLTSTFSLRNVTFLSRCWTLKQHNDIIVSLLSTESCFATISGSRKWNMNGKYKAFDKENG